MDDRGVARGKCTMPSCSCLQYERQGRVKRCTCGHVPTKHDVANQPDVVRDEDSDFDSQFEECISLDHTQPPSTPVSDSMPSSDSALTVPQAWSMPSATQSPTVAGGPGQLGNKCAIPECDSPRYIDPSGHEHDCCGFTHAMELQRRQAIQSAPMVKGVTHCLLPWCSSIVWPFMNYCCRTHANFGDSMGLQPPVVQPAATLDQSTSLLHEKDDTMCSLPQCRAPRYREPDGRVHPFCGRSHAKMAETMNIAVPVPPGEKCIIPECKRRRYTDGSVTHWYCSKSHAEEGRKRGIFPSATDPKDQCDLPNCTRPKAVEANGYKYNHCCRDHALKDDQNILTKRPAVDSFLKQFSGTLKVVNLIENQSAKPGGALFQRFQSAWRGLSSNHRRTILAFHGTPEANIQSICTNGFDPTKRSGQAYGPGEYFAKTPGTPMGYCQGGKKMLLCELLLGQTNHTMHGDYVVMKNPNHDLPRFIVEFS